MSHLKPSRSTQGPIIQRGHESDVYSVTFSPDGKLAVSGSADETVRIWDANNSSSVGEPLKGHSNAVRSVAYSSFGELVASGSWDRTVRLWNINTSQDVGKPMQGHSGFIHSIAFSPNASLIASGSGDKTIRLWDINNNTSASDPLKGHSKSVSSVVFSLDNARIISGSDDKTIRIWNIERGVTVIGPLEHAQWVRSITVSPDDSQIASGSDDKTVRLWDPRSGSAIGEPYIGHTGWIMSVAFSPDGVYVASGASDQTVRIWDTRTGRQLDMPFRKHTGTVYSVAFSPCGRRIASCSADKTVMIWDSSDRNADPDREPKAEDKPELFEVENKEQTVPSIQAVFELLIRHGCTDLTTKMDSNQDTAVMMGGGGFGDIWMGRLHDGMKVAIKAWRVYMPERWDYKTLKRATREIHTWSRMKHKNIHELMGVIMFKGSCLGMVSEWMENGDMRQYLAKNPQADRYQMCAQVASGLEYMHQFDVIHGDLKALNVLVSSEGVAKLADFGLSTMTGGSLVFSETSKFQFGSVRWAAPEHLTSEPLKTKQSDVYALGMTMLEIFTGAVPYSQYQDTQVIKMVDQGVLPPRPMDRFKDDSYGNRLWSLLVSSWSRNPAARPSAEHMHASLRQLILSLTKE